MFYGNLPEFGNYVKVGNKVKFGNKVTIYWSVWLMEDFTVYGHAQNVKEYMGEGDVTLFHEIPILTI